MTTTSTKLTLAHFSDPVVREAILPLLGSISCGFPSPAGDYIEKELDLVSLLIPRPSSTFFAWASGTSLIHRGIPSKALLILDASLEAHHDDVVAAVVDGELTCKVYDKVGRCLRDAGDRRIEIRDGQVQVFGVVKAAVNILCSR